ncbi:hypothetical protein MEW_06191, partial [Candida albicans P60002]
MYEDAIWFKKHTKKILPYQSFS